MGTVVIELSLYTLARKVGLFIGWQETVMLMPIFSLESDVTVAI